MIDSGQKLGVFLCIVFLSQTDRENVFADILDRKEAFKDYRKIWLGKTQH